MLVLAFGLVLLVGCAETEAGESLEVAAVLAGRPAAGATALDPIELRHEEITELALTVTNTTEQPLTIAHVRLEGQLLNLIFLTYDTGVHETVGPGETRTIAFALDFFDLRGQAHGLLRSHIRLFDDDRRPLGQQSLVIDGRGSPLATMATFNLVLALVAAVSIGWNLVRLGQRRLPANRFLRGLRFLHSGAAVGLTVAAAASTLRVWPLTPATWVPLVALASGAAFALGYLSPGADDEGEILIDLVAADRRRGEGSPLTVTTDGRPGGEQPMSADDAPLAAGSTSLSRPLPDRPLEPQGPSPRSEP